MGKTCIHHCVRTPFLSTLPSSWIHTHHLCSESFYFFSNSLSMFLNITLFYISVLICTLALLVLLIYKVFSNFCAYLSTLSKTFSKFWTKKKQYTSQRSRTVKHILLRCIHNTYFIHFPCKM